jgi:hypothetical protein
VWERIKQATKFCTVRQERLLVIYLLKDVPIIYLDNTSNTKRANKNVA